MKFAIVLGSYARGDNNIYSDYDVCCINTTLKEVYDNNNISIPETYVNEINYTIEEFENFHNNGSLFIFHTLYEGKLLHGNAEEWDRYKNNFKVQKNFSREIERIYEVSEYFKEPKMFGGMFLTPLSNAFVELKNASIFFNAHQGVYEFNKHRSLKTLMSLTNWDSNFIELHKYYDYSVRNFNLELPFEHSSKEMCENLIFKTHNIIKEIRSCL